VHWEIAAPWQALACVSACAACHCAAMWVALKLFFKMCVGKKKLKLLSRLACSQSQSRKFVCPQVPSFLARQCQVYTVPIACLPTLLTCKK